MKKAVIVVGSHNVGKSKTIREYLKPKLGLSKHQKKFILNDKNGYILSQSFEEGNKNIEEMINKYSHYNYLVLAGRPTNEKISYTLEVEKKLKSKSYHVKVVDIQRESDESYYDKKASIILEYLRQ